MIAMLLHTLGNNSLRTSILFFSFICISLLSTAQQKKVTGVVRDSTGNPLQGVSIIVASTRAGTSTDSRGNYTIDAPWGATLIFSYANREAARVTIGEGNEYDVRLAPLVSALNDVVVVGYGRQKR